MPIGLHNWGKLGHPSTQAVSTGLPNFAGARTCDIDAAIAPHRHLRWLAKGVRPTARLAGLPQHQQLLAGWRVFNGLVQRHICGRVGGWMGWVGQARGRPACGHAAGDTAAQQQRSKGEGPCDPCAAAGASGPALQLRQAQYAYITAQRSTARRRSAQQSCTCDPHVAVVVCSHHVRHHQLAAAPRAQQRAAVLVHLRAAAGPA